jgi:hypothetical protein
MSTRTPELLVRGATAKKPLKKRLTSKVVIVRTRLADLEDGAHRESADKDGPSTN